MTDNLVPAFSKIFMINASESAGVQISFYGAYAVLAIFASILLEEFSYKAGVLIGLMYFGYSVGLVASLSLAPLMRVFKTPTRLILFASAVYVASCLTLAVPSLWALFGGLWLIAFGEFVVHSISPGLINHQAPPLRHRLNLA